MQNEEKKPSEIRSGFCVPRSDFDFPRSYRLSGKLLFSAVYDAKVKCSRGPLVGYSLPNTLGHSRMGISISRRVGTAPRRNRIKRLLREAFRQSSSAVSMDFIIVVRPHAPFRLAEYQASLAHLMTRCDTLWKQRI